MDTNSVVTNIATTLTYQDGAIVSKEILRRFGGTITLFAFDTEQGLSEHKTPFDALVQVLDGEAHISLAGTQYFLKKGDCIVMPANIPHAVKAIKRFKMILTMLKNS